MENNKLIKILYGGNELTTSELQIKRQLWNALSRQFVDVQILRENAEHMNWDIITTIQSFMINRSVRSEALDEFKDYINWDILCKSYKFSLHDLEKFENYVNWKLVSRTLECVNNDEFIIKYKDRFDWDELCKNKNVRFSDETIRACSNYVNWHILSKHYHHLSEDIVREFINVIPLYNIIGKHSVSDENKYSIDLLVSNHRTINWKRVSRYYNLTTEEIEAYAEYLRWDKISYSSSAIISESILEKFGDRISWYDALSYACREGKKYSIDFIESTVFKYIKPSIFLQYYMDLIDAEYYIQITNFAMKHLVDIKDNLLPTAIALFRKYEFSQCMLEDLIKLDSSPDMFKNIAHFQTLSEEFMIKYINSLDVKIISIYQNLSIDFILKYIDKVYYAVIIECNNRIDKQTRDAIENILDNIK